MFRWLLTSDLGQQNPWAKMSVEGVGRVLGYNQSIQLPNRLWGLWGRISVEQKLTWEPQRHFSKSRGTKASSWSWQWDRRKIKYDHCFAFVVQAYVSGFHPKSIDHFPMSTPFPVFHGGPSLIWAAISTVGLGGARDFWQQLVIGYKKDFPTWNSW